MHEAFVGLRLIMVVFCTVSSKSRIDTLVRGTMRYEPQKVSEKPRAQAAQKNFRGEAREKSILRPAQDRLMGGVLRKYAVTGL